MTEELKQKAKDFIDRINKESGGNWLDKYYLTDLLVMFATEETKELNARLNAINLLTPELQKKSQLKTQQLTKAKDYILKLTTYLEGHTNYDFEYELIKEVKQFLSEVEK